MLVKIKDLEPWRGESLETLTDEATVTYEDGRVDSIKVEPYPVSRRLPPNVEVMWTRADLLAYGLLRVVPTVPPAGKRFVGAPRYARDGDVAREIYEVEDVPPEPDVVTISADEHARLVADAEKWRTATANVPPRDEEKK